MSIGLDSITIKWKSLYLSVWPSVLIVAGKYTDYGKDNCSIP